MAGHTPGPWVEQLEMDDYSLDVDGASVSTASAVGPEGKRPVAIITTIGWGADNVHDANARLIAKAPELLDLITLALPYVEDAADHPVHSTGVPASLAKRMRHVIQEAEGRSA